HHRGSRHRAIPAPHRRAAGDAARARPRLARLAQCRSAGPCGATGSCPHAPTDARRLDLDPARSFAAGGQPSSRRGAAAECRTLLRARHSAQRSAMSDAAPERIPVSVITGFLGSGKTTLLKRLLPQPAMADTAVIINEFGEVGLDHLLVETSND